MCEGDEWEMCERWEGDGWEMWGEMGERWVRDVREMRERWVRDEWEMWGRRWVRDVWEIHSIIVNTVASTHFTAMWLSAEQQVLFCYFLGFNHSIIVNTLLIVLISLHCSCKRTFRDVLFCYFLGFIIVNTLLLVLISLHCSCRTAFKCHIFCWLIVNVCDLSFQWEVGFVSLQKSLLKVTSLLYTDDTANASINMSNQGQTSNCSCRISTDTC